MKKTLLVQLILAFCLGLFTSCGNGKSGLDALKDNVKYKKIELVANGTAKQCPFSMGVLGEATQFALEDDLLTVEVQLNKKFKGIKDLSEHEDLFCEVGVFAFVNDSIPFPWDDFIDLNLTLEFRFLWKNDTSEYAFDGEGLKEVLEISRDEAFGEVWLEDILTISNLTAPSMVDEMTTFVGTDVLDSKIVHNYEVDEEQCDLDPLIEDPEILRAVVAQTLFSDASEQVNIRSLCKKTEKNIVYRYTGNQTGKDLEIEFDYQEF